jgi:hypothetical protein
MLPVTNPERVDKEPELVEEAIAQERADKGAAPISSVVARSVLQSQREVRFGTPLLGQDAVSAADLPHVAVGIGERASVSPFLVSGFDDDLGASVLRATHQLVDLGISGQPDHDLTLMCTPGRSFTITDHPAEAARRNQHHTQTDADLKLQGLGYAIIT